MINRTAITISIIFTVISFSTIRADETNRTTSFIGQTPSSEQLVEALKRPPRQLQLRGISITPAPPKVLLNIPFEFNSAQLTPEAQETLRELGKALASAELIKNDFEIAGHTDAKGTVEYNLQLSENRALVVSRYLLENHNIESSRLRTVGKGEAELLNKRDPEDEVNRRVEIINLGNSRKMK